MIEIDDEKLADWLETRNGGAVIVQRFGGQWYVSARAMSEEGRGGFSVLDDSLPLAINAAQIEVDAAIARSAK